MRLFVAIELDAAARTAVTREQRRLAEAVRRHGGGDDGGLRLVRSEQLHMTLVFLGDVAADVAEAVVATFAAPIVQPPYSMAFAAAGVFPLRGNPRVLWLGLAGGEAETRAVQAEVLGRVLAAGATVDDRDFTPHLTLGRWRAGRGAHRAAVSAASDADLVATLQVRQVTVFESRLSSAGAVHTPLATSVLRCP